MMQKMEVVAPMLSVKAAKIAMLLPGFRRQILMVFRMSLVTKDLKKLPEPAAPNKRTMQNFYRVWHNQSTFPKSREHFFDRCLRLRPCPSHPA
jgi:hypothetical protein